MSKKINRAIALTAVGILGASAFAFQGENIAPIPGQDSTVIERAVGASFDPNFFISLSEKVVPSVVNISVSWNEENQSPDNSSELFRRHFEEFFSQRGRPGLSPPSWAPAPPSSERQALGSGVVIEVNKGKAIVLTNNHVVGKATDIQIQLDPKIYQEKLQGKLIGTDRDLDLALIEVEVPKSVALRAMPLGDSDELKVGEFVMAVGNPFGQGHSVSHGIISAKGRNAPIIGKYIQTDAPINPGNSGGPLVNLKGQIIGINNAILAQAQGIGFSIPSNSVKSVLDQLKKDGKVTRGYLGIQMGAISPEAAAFAGEKVKLGQPFIAAIEPGSPAEKAGLKTNDIILSFEGAPIETPRDLLITVTKHSVGENAKLKILRSGKEKHINIKVGKRPA